MKILHYALGFFPYRTGGLTKYCEDLMKEQILAGHEVLMLWPGSVGNKRKKPVFKRDKREDGIISCEICGALPVALDEGILQVKKYMQHTDKQAYVEFLRQENPDMIHIHTLMGLHKEFLEAAKEAKIKIIYTTHDYYGLCFKPTFFYAGEVCDGECSHCFTCNQSALPVWKIRLLQTPFYRSMKDSRVVKYLRKRHRKNFFDGNEQLNKSEEIQDHQKEAAYRKLREYYISMFDMVDLFHFNSRITRNLFLKYMEPKAYRVLSISHAGIKRQTTLKPVDVSHISVSFLGPLNAAKGYDLLQKTLEEMYADGWKNFSLHVFAGEQKINAFTVSHDRYDYSQLAMIMKNTDLVVVPSIWYETFSFVVLESLSFGVPVLVSDRVGAADLIQQGKNGWIFRLEEGELKRVLQEILTHPEKLHEIRNQFMAQEQKILNIHEHATDMENLYEYVQKET